jgi:hypothetical protein
VPLEAEEVAEKAEIRRTLQGREYWRMINVWLHTVLKRKGINTVSAQAWNIHEFHLSLSVPDEAELQ